MKYKLCKTYDELNKENNRRACAWGVSTYFDHTKQGRHINRMRQIAAIGNDAMKSFQKNLIRFTRPLRKRIKFADSLKGKL